jgi:hypothetical protein
MRTAVSRVPGAERVVSPLELFYVFAIGQLSHHLLERVDLRNGAETVVMALAVFYAWYMTAWRANWLEPDRLPVRLLLVGLMFASLLEAVAVSVGRKPHPRRPPHRRLTPIVYPGEVANSVLLGEPLTARWLLTPRQLWPSSVAVAQTCEV